ncbi:hypothetical protein J7F01_16975 [Streptomyces sp. ISL-22]|uniref:DUF6081 family protein n=1 Tax=unclassified Streptomyces TaxID=2593676 RepID=UPI001BE5C049|nr:MULTISPECIES: DUF6081 family protein [unclassified Streptomyces]MBT2423719.1 hypothetical protein [Streptomyces sp. ISL-24]MBT2433843.1 hypothetical protein [Streptomyces sp. ISL-22]
MRRSAMRRRSVLLGLLAAASVPGTPVTAAAASGAADPVAADGDRVVWDDFQGGFDHSGDGSKWTLTPAGDALPDGDGIATTSAAGLRVVPTGVNPRTGEPAFAFTTGRESEGGGGAADHLKFFALARHTSKAGILGFDAEPGRVLTIDVTMSARTFGTEQHPFGAAVANPRTDLRLAAGAMNTADPETLMVFDFFVTNGFIYAFYERLPRPGADYAAFSYALPVARRATVDQVNNLAVAYDRSAGTVEWKLDGRTVLSVDRIGYKPADRKHLILDLGGREELVQPRQLAGGFGMFTLLDAEMPGAEGGLVRLSDDLRYYDPDRGAPAQQGFTDPAGLPQHRLWGQGARLDVCQIGVTSAPR